MQACDRELCTTLIRKGCRKHTVIVCSIIRHIFRKSAVVLPNVEHLEVSDNEIGGKIVICPRLQLTVHCQLLERVAHPPACESVQGIRVQRLRLKPQPKVLWQQDVTVYQRDPSIAFELIDGIIEPALRQYGPVAIKEDL